MMESKLNEITSIAKDHAFMLRNARFNYLSAGLTGI